MAKSLSVHSGSLILVNASLPFLDTQAQDSLVPVGTDTGSVFLERRSAALLNKLMGEIRGWGSIAAVSGWRSRGEQQEIWDDSIQENGEAFTQKYVALPGHSEHQTGLAIDLGLRQESIDFIRPSFPYTGICQSFRRRAASFGFIERYGEEKSHITKIAHEPWHFRYVGVPHAEVMDKLGLCLEEYHEFLRRFPYGEGAFVYEQERRMFCISFLSASGADALPPEDDGSFCTMISGNNLDGFIVTQWKDMES